MTLVPFRREHLEDFDGERYLPGMYGLTLLGEDSRALFCGGGVTCEWGEELWIAVRPWLDESQKLKVGRIARTYFESLLAQHGELWTSTLVDQPRWLEWFGFEFVEAMDSEVGEIKRWKVRKELTWSVQQQL